MTLSFLSQDTKQDPDPNAKSATGDKEKNSPRQSQATSEEDKQIGQKNLENLNEYVSFQSCYDRWQLCAEIGIGQDRQRSIYKDLVGCVGTSESASVASLVILFFFRFCSNFLALVVSYCHRMTFFSQRQVPTA